jgi:NAD(P)-dependent dehydrogenase (short-subunit alcohol dehydrogenase family)
MPTYPELQNKVVLVTGGANGIGQATVRAFHAAGARVYFCDVDQSAGQRLARQLETRFQAVDLRQEKQVARWIQSILTAHNTVHTLVNNAAHDPRIPLDQLSTAKWDDLMARNLRACMLTVRQAAPALVPGSSIINLSSITFHLGPAHMSAYVATKAGLIGFTRALARELGPRRIRVNTVSPGWVMTERQLREYVSPAVKRRIRRAQSIPDLIQPEEIAQVILFLASEGSRAITGQEILVDRGWAHS